MDKTEALHLPCRLLQNPLEFCQRAFVVVFTPHTPPFAGEGVIVNFFDQIGRVPGGHFTQSSSEGSDQLLCHAMPISGLASKSCSERRWQNMSTIFTKYQESCKLFSTTLTRTASIGTSAHRTRRMGPPPLACPVQLQPRRWNSDELSPLH